jgi:hypothetical protein
VEKKMKDNFVFSNEDAVLRIAAVAMITSWVILLIYVVSFILGVSPFLNGTVSGSQLFEQPSAILNLVYPLAMGMVYFCVLQGVTHLLHLGLDIYYSFDVNDDVDDSVE